MPVYVYHCDHCGQQHEIFQHYTDDSITVCPECKQAALQKVYQLAYVQFKGDGWYVTDKHSNCSCNRKSANLRL